MAAAAAEVILVAEAAMEQVVGTKVLGDSAGAAGGSMMGLVDLAAVAAAMQQVDLAEAGAAIKSAVLGPQLGTQPKVAMAQL